jgi:D-arabinose 1-dehydrogenase-like Zn-dependent alcohol dehydrogenase
MAKTMKAAIVRNFKEPLSIEEVPIPEVGAGRILVKIEACGVCHTDLHAADGDWPVKPNPPFIPGHEGVGTVAAAGKGVPAVKEGDRVGMPLKETDAKPGDTVVISGIGGLGHVAIQYAKAMGLGVIAVDISDEKLSLARKMGADDAVNAKTTDAAAEVKKLCGGARGVLVTAVSPKAFSQALGMLGKGARWPSLGCRRVLSSWTFLAPS